MFAPLPILYVTAINKKKSADGDKNSNTYLCPVYKVLDYNNFLVSTKNRQVFDI